MIEDPAAPSIWWDNLDALARSIGPLALVATALSLIAGGLCRYTGKSYWETVIFVSPFAWLGAACGFIAGSSKEALIGALLTGILTVAGTLFTYMFGQDSDDKWSKPLPLAMMLLFLCALVGITAGNAQRGKWEDFDREYAKWQHDYETITLPVRAAQQRFDTCKFNVSEARKAQCDDLLLSTGAGGSNAVNKSAPAATPKPDPGAAPR
jgi:hypothetical protein